MTAVPVTRTYVAGETLLASYPNTNINGPLNFLLNPPIFKGRQTIAQSLGNGAATAITLDAEDVDSANGHSTITNTSRYTAVYPGWYWAEGGVSFANNATGVRLANLALNGVGLTASSVETQTNTAGDTNTLPTRGTLGYLNVNDYLEVMGTQTSGAGLNTTVAPSFQQPSLCLFWKSN